MTTLPWSLTHDLILEPSNQRALIDVITGILLKHEPCYIIEPCLRLPVMEFMLKPEGKKYADHTIGICSKLSKLYLRYEL